MSYIVISIYTGLQRETKIYAGPNGVLCIIYSYICTNKVMMATVTKLKLLHKRAFNVGYIMPVLKCMRIYENLVYNFE